MIDLALMSYNPNFSVLLKADEDEEEAGLTIDEQPASKSKTPAATTPATTPATTTATNGAKKRKADGTPSAPPKKKVSILFPYGMG